MQIRSEINSRYTEIELHVCNNELTSEVKDMMARLHNYFDSSLTGTDEAGNRCILRPADIVSFYAEGQRVIAMDEAKKYVVSRKLYELEKEYESLCFVRISKSELVNYRKIRSLDMSLTGTIKVIMKNGYETYSSRRNVSRLKELLLQKRKSAKA